MWAAARGYEGYGTLPAAQEGAGAPSPSVPGEILHVSTTGQVLLHTYPQVAGGVSVNSTEGSCWVVTDSGVAHIDANGQTLWQGSVVGSSVSVNPTDGSCWVAGGTVITLLSTSGTQVFLALQFLSRRRGDRGESDGRLVLGGGEFAGWGHGLSPPGTSAVLHLAAHGRVLSQHFGV